MRISDWSSDVCSSDLADTGDIQRSTRLSHRLAVRDAVDNGRRGARPRPCPPPPHIWRAAHAPAGAAPSDMRRRWARSRRSEEHTSELQSLMRISYAVFCLKKKNNNKETQTTTYDG